MPTGPIRLILIRSSLYDYAEVELVGALQIVGPNNIGKTTLIKTLQFLYLNDRRHMDFGSHTPEETREFYFPSQYSYILFECIGTTGQCVVGWRGQSKNSGGDPERFSYIGPFELADYLVETSNQVREPREVDARLSLRQLRKVKSTEEHKDLLLPPADAETRGLGIISLNQREKYHQFRETLKNLLTLSAITQEQMRDCLLLLADIPPDRTAFDAREMFGADYDRLCTRREKLEKFKKNEAVIQKLVTKFTERDTIRGELVWRWTDLREKRKAFEKEHHGTIKKLADERDLQQGKFNQLDAELSARRNEVNLFSVDQGKVTKPLEDLENCDREFAGFAEELERAALANLQKEIRVLENQLANAERESREKLQQKLSLYGGLVQQKEQTIALFDRLAVTALRKHFDENELNSLFRLLNPEMLETPIGQDGIEIARQKETVVVLRELVNRIKDGIYRDANICIPLRGKSTPLTGLENVDTAAELLKEYRETLERLQGILLAIGQRERLENQLTAKRAERDGQRDAKGVEIKEGRVKQLIRFEEYQRTKAGEPQLRAALKKVMDAIEAANKSANRLTIRSKAAEKAKGDAEAAIRKQENEFNLVMGRFENDCIFPDFTTKPWPLGDITGDFEYAMALFIKQQEKQETLSGEITGLLAETERWLGDEFHGQEERETVGKLQEELEGLYDKEQALTKLWDTHFAALKGTFENVLTNLGDVATAAGELNRAFGKVRVSNLKAVKLELVEQADLMSWIKRLAAFEAGGLFDRDPQRESAIANFRRKVQDNPVIRFADLFTLGVTVTGADNRKRSYPDFREIESHGTTISIKVLFNLLLLKNQLRRDDCCVPFYLDEIQDLDPANRLAILSEAKKLGFIAITAAPEAVSEVDALYFLEPQNGKIVLRKKHWVGVQRTEPVIAG